MRRASERISRQFHLANAPEPARTEEPATETGYFLQGLFRKVIFGDLCQTCHTTGAGGAPKITDKAAWAPRVAEGIDTLIKHATEGFTGKSGTMPPKGGNPALNDAQIKATVEWIVSQVK